MKTLKDYLLEAKENRFALPHFNFSDSTQFNAIAEVAKELNSPIIVGVSEGEKKFIKIQNAVALKEAAQKLGIKIFLNLDHGHSVEDCKEAIDEGFDSVMFDGSKLSFQENVLKTKEVVDYAREYERKTGKKVLVEGELGYIGSSSKMLDNIPEGAGLQKTSKEQAREFVSQTGVDILAPSVGNIHGMLKHAKNPELDIERISEIANSIPNTFLVLHGGSGISDDNFKEAIKSGINIVHINTEIRKAYKEGIQEYLKENPEEVAPYRFLSAGKEKMKEVLLYRAKLFLQIPI